MKAVVQALFLMTSAIGNLFDLLVVALFSDLFKSQVKGQKHENRVLTKARFDYMFRN
jgi:lipoprotein signal peptidase